MIPIITNINDNPGTTADDAANLPPAYIYACVGFTVDVRGPGFTTGDVTWSVLDSNNTPVVGAVANGQNTIQALIYFPSSTAPGDYTIKACLTADPTDCTTSAITVLPAPPITITTPNQPYIGGRTQFNTTMPFPITWSPAEVDSDGLATWSTAGFKNVTYTLADSNCSVSTTYQVYSDISVAQYTAGNCIYINSGQNLALTVTGGTGNYQFSITGQNTVTNTGVIQAGLYAGEYTVSVIDKVAGIIKHIPVCIGSQTQFCIAVEEAVCTQDIVDPCCEVTVDCGETVTLKVPTFHMRVNGVQEEIKYHDAGSGITGEAGYLKSGGTITNASANDI